MHFQYYGSFLLLLTFVINITCKTEWIDPFSMDEESAINDECECICPSLQSNSLGTSHYVRTISMLLKSLRFDSGTDLYKVQYDIGLTPEEYKIIEEFLSNGMDDPVKWDQMDQIISKNFQPSVWHEYSTQFLAWKEYLLFNAFSKETAICLGIICIFWIYHKAKHSNITWLSIFKFSFCFGAIVDYIYTWILLLKEKELEQLLHVTYTIPPECDVKKMSYWQSFLYFSQTLVGKDKCQEYHKIKDIDIFWSVSPSQVLGTQLGNLIITPADKIGNALGKLTSAVFHNTSWYFMVPTLLMLPLLLFVLLLCGCIILSFLTGRTFSFSFFHLFSFSFGKSEEKVTHPETTQTKRPLLLINRQKRLRLTGKKKTNSEAPKPLTSKQHIEELPIDSKEESDEETDNDDAVLDEVKFVEHDYEIIG